MKIKVKLCLIYGLLLAVIMVVTTLYGVSTVNAISVEKNNELLQTNATLKVKALNEKLMSLFSTLQMGAREIEISEDLNFSPGVVIETLKSIQEQLGSIESYFALADGIAYDSLVAGGPIPDFNAKELQREWFLSVMRDHKKMFMTEPYFSVTTNKNVIGLGVPISRNNEDVGSLCIDIELNRITDYIAGLSDNRDFFLTNESGIIFASRNPEEIGKNIFEIHPGFNEYAGMDDREFDYNWSGADNQKYKVVLKSIDVLPWKFWQYRSYAEINREGLDYLHDSVVFCIVFLVLTLVVVYIIAIYIARPIIENARIIAKFATTGDTDLKEENRWSNRRDEIGVMSRAFNDMITVLHKKAMTAKEIAGGNLAVGVSVLSPRDHLGMAFAQMVHDLNRILGRVNTAVNEVTGGSVQISSSSNLLSEGATRQAASIEEISASITELSGQTRTNAENAAAANSLAAETAEAAKDGQQQMDKLSQAMNQIRVNSQETQKVIKTIDDIAFQTNLLALNAAVEAARAGVHGKGFAVVAEEVRNLAARSAKAAAETADLIQNSNNQIVEGVNITELTVNALSKIADNVVQTSLTVQEIASASTEQAEGISQIGIGLEQIDSVTNQNTANAEEVAESSEQMSAQARMLQELVAHFRLKTEDKSDNVKKAKAKSLPPELGDSSGKDLNEWEIVGSDGVVAENADLVRPADFVTLDSVEFAKF